MRVEIRGAEWTVKAVHTPVRGRPGESELQCVGISPIVRGREAFFISGFEDITVLRPEETMLVQDFSSQYLRSRLFLDALLRRTPATDDKVHIAQHAAMNVMNYQLQPAVQALSSVRPRILIADAVGLGKTLEAGILVSELIERGRGKRILVVTVKAMLEQFRKEFWNRFTIDLAPLDTEGVERLKARIPEGQNPFLHVDRAIISMDAFKGMKYPELLQAHWDILLIDEAHNVADRGTGSQRSRLAEKLADQCDALILLTATPHDGRPESFASLIRLLDPTVIRDPSDYTGDDLKGKNLLILRGKKDVEAEAGKAFLPRVQEQIVVDAGPAMEGVCSLLYGRLFESIDSHRREGRPLFRTTLLKALFSSPFAAADTLEKRIEKLTEKTKHPDESVRSAACRDLEALEAILKAVQSLRTSDFTKFGRLVEMLSPDEEYGWSRESDDRLVIFTESVKTLGFLKKNLPGALGMQADEIIAVQGTDPDAKIREGIEAFNTPDSPVRVLLATDVASEGINLHSLCHRLIHFDIPWPLMTFQQRNGRIDRYGQKKQPIIRYLYTESVHDGDTANFGDFHVLERLQEKDLQASKNLSITGEFGTAEEQEAETAAEIEGRQTGTFRAQGLPERKSSSGGRMTMQELMASLRQKQGKKEVRTLSADRSLLFRDWEFLREVLQCRLGDPPEAGGLDAKQLNLDIDPRSQRVSFNAPSDFQARLAYLPHGLRPENDRFVLSSNTVLVQKAIDDVSRLPTRTRPAMQLLWELHPAMQWAEDWALASFGRHAAPVLVLPEHLQENEIWCLLQGGFPNLRGFTQVHDWTAVRLFGGAVTLHSRAELQKQLPKDGFLNAGRQLSENQLARLQEKLPICVHKAQEALEGRRRRWLSETQPRHQKQLAALDALQDTGLYEFPDLAADERKTLTRRQQRETSAQEFLKSRRRETRRYAHDVLTLAPHPWIQVAAVFCGRLTDCA